MSGGDTSRTPRRGEPADLAVMIRLAARLGETSTSREGSRARREKRELRQSLSNGTDISRVFPVTGSRERNGVDGFFARAR